MRNMFLHNLLLAQQVNPLTAHDGSTLETIAKMFM